MSPVGAPSPGRPLSYVPLRYNHTQAQYDPDSAYMAEPEMDPSFIPPNVDEGSPWLQGGPEAAFKLP